IMATIESDQRVRVVVLTGTGEQFCVGADAGALEFYKETGADYVESIQRTPMATPGHGVRPEFGHDLVWLWGLRMPVIAAINGACAGIATALASFCDLRY